MTTKEEKQRRMTLRRKTGNRKIPETPKSYRGPEYLVAHACFICRKSYKLAQRDGGTPVCPECSGQLNEMGRSFKVPPNKNIEQWEKVEALYKHGFRFYSFRSYPDAPPLPEKLSEVETFVKNNPNHPFKVDA